MTEQVDPAYSHANPEERRSKRKRISLACKSCRVRKTKCDGVQPVCGACIDMNLTCGYVRRKDLKSQNAEDNLPLENRLKAIEETLQMLVTQNEDGPKTTRGQGDTISSPSGSAPLASLTASTPWTNETIGASCETEMTLTPHPETLSSDTVDGMVIITFADEAANAHFAGSSSNSALFAQIRGALAEIWQSNHLDRTNLGPQVNDSTLISRPASPTPRSQLIRNPDKRIMDHLLLPSKGYILASLNSFFSSGIGVLFPYLYKKPLVDELAVIGIGGLRGVRRSWLCLLNTIMAFSAESVAPTWKTKPTSDTVTFLNRALYLLPEIALQPADLESFQALLLLLQFLQGTQYSSKTWAVKGLVVHAAYQIGLHSSSENAKYTPLEREIRTRCWHMCTILDKTCSMTFGRPQAIQVRPPAIDLPCEVELATLDDDPSARNFETGQTGSEAVIVFTQSIKLYGIVAMILDEVYKNNMNGNDTISSLDVYHSIMLVESKLAAWRASVPPQLQSMIPFPVSSGMDTSVGFGQEQGLGMVLTLRYLHTRMLLHRQMISCFLRHERTVKTGHSELPFLMEFGKSSLEVCLRSAVHIIDGLRSQFTNAGQLRSLTTSWFQIYYGSPTVRHNEREAFD
ncbi:hypothetical protein PV10_07870 [Exophiala mesophila]|uniref:Zn(2)-C6 fungal-type domain-containing protein n=1 Tax=Exophiala mesophila TaxID=212818 RepID=A0A0D1Z987_EXOME|nr:uncharacterized protein PV10_07870 [Exophiala mesophila]KIV90584.1 hypothetical protein PV10_07870 [Exophiala mesophila]